ncbi:MAG: FKBP-type peptidyl-prolyl cis-trans isomerase [Nanoarchaeota archaeon]|nr:FKBP-type peptidyl-prolyl cis-trans isomerase [Nanoarchaeota archaeon]
MKFVKRGDLVKVDYIGMNNNSIFNTSMRKYAKESKIYERKKDYSPLCFKVGDANVIQGFNEVVLGMRIGEEKTIPVAPIKAYGNYKKNLVKKYPKAIFENQGIALESGLTINLNLRSGVLRANVVKVKKEHVTLDMNHEFAGKTLIFKIMLRDIIA